MLDPLERFIALIAVLAGVYVSSVDATLKILEYMHKRKKERSAQRSSDDEAKG
ncbi:hypothetical protein [Shouchella clausii]|uniref:hypothetical protein n=1 Tax=Shouchella clausii TaxID=79880 RepID=UPI0012FE384B|nr:hypothetical protein [Shouchella clausii]MBU8594619.1 hypothetical protein [Shouchella clausii]MCR1286581.1 hypothetical protein [Shouchella clausii]MCY1104730.1 hypothetical protein [Shouchella clausii]MEB5473896.1 hypothetical protein [Shouchella clausii]MEB5478281.1 hypothetical protein [Shouchella clausii]